MRDWGGGGKIFILGEGESRFIIMRIFRYLSSRACLLCQRLPFLRIVATQTLPLLPLHFPAIEISNCCPYFIKFMQDYPIITDKIRSGEQINIIET